MTAERRLSVAVVQGGPSAEAHVSRASAAAVAVALAQAKHRVVRVELDAFVAESLRTGGYDVVFPMAHGAVGEDGALQGVLEVLDLPYVGSDVVASAMAMHKRVARVVLAAAGLPVARGFAASRAHGDALELATRARREIGDRLVVKPSSQGSAIGVARLGADAPIGAIAAAIEAAWALSTHAIVEHFARGREITCGVLALEAPRALPVTEITAPHDPFYTFEARYGAQRSLHTCPALLPASVALRVQDAAVAAHVALGARDLSRVDFIVGDEGAPDAVTLLEVNTLPGMTATSLFPEAADAAGLSMPKLCDALVMQAYRRGPTERHDARSLPSGL